MSVFSGLNKLKDALDDAIHDDQKDTPKTQAEIHGEARKEQEKSGLRDRVSPCSRDQLLGIDLVSTDR